jgi:hypothetical protein
LTRDRLQYHLLAAGDKYFSAKILGLQWNDGIEHASSTLFPPVHNLGSRRAGIDNEFLIAMPVGLFVIGGQEICPAGAHMTPHTLYEDGGAIRIGINETTNIFMASLRESLPRVSYSCGSCGVRRRDMPHQLHCQT